jgi:hypothetical protein
MTLHEFTSIALNIIRPRKEQDLAACGTFRERQAVIEYYDTCYFYKLFGQPSHERTCYEKDGKHYLRSYNSHVKVGDEYYDAYNLWELDGDNLKYLGGLHR